MAIWPFGKKKDAKQEPARAETEQAEAPAPAPTPEPPRTPEEPAPVNEAAPMESSEPAGTEEEAAVEPVHDAVDGGTGPFDGDSVDIEEFDFSDFSTSTINLGSMKIPLPKESQVQVEMGEQGPKMLHIVTTSGRITPVAFAAPRTSSQWREAAKEIAEGMRGEGLEVAVEMGPWGREVVGTGNNGIIRIIGIDGPRWMLRMTLAAPKDKAEDLAVIGREITARTFVYRGDDPVLAGSSLPVALPTQLAQQVQQALQQRAQQQQQGQQNPQAQQAQQARQAPQRQPAPSLSPEEQQALQEAEESLRTQGGTQRGDTGNQNPPERQ